MHVVIGGVEMKLKTVIVVLMCAAVVSAKAATTIELVTVGDVTRYEITVPEGETYTLVEDDVTLFGTTDILKTGGGTLVADAVMTNYTGDIYITNGIYHASAGGACGPNAGKVVVSGTGTLMNSIPAPVTYTDAGGYPSLGLVEKVYLEGSGYDGQGALCNSQAYCANFARYTYLTGDTLIATSGGALHFRYATFDMNYHKLTLKATQNGIIAFVASSNLLRKEGDIELINPGDAEVGVGRLHFESTYAAASSTNTVTIHSGQTVSFRSLSSHKHNFVMKDASSFQGDLYPIPFGTTSLTNNIAGTVTLEGMVTNKLPARIGLTIEGQVTGDGGFVPHTPGTSYLGGWLQLANPSNSFAGGIEFVGRAGLGDLSVTGGVSLIENGAIPTNGAPFKLRDAALHLYNSKTYTANIYDLPDMIVDGRTLITNATFRLNASTVKSFTKKGDDVFTTFTAFKVLGNTDIQGGTVRFGSAVPSTPAGLNWYYAWLVSGSPYDTAPRAAVPFQGVDCTGLSYAYEPWRPTTGPNNAPAHVQTHYYTGYIRIPGEEGQSVTCNFVSSIARNISIRIDNTFVVQVNDNIDRLTGTNISYARLYVGPQVTLTAGWRRFFVYMGNYWNSTAGALPNTGLGWTASFGAGVDWQGRCETNAANYVKFLDPGDGSFLRPCMTRAELDPAMYRPSFGGNVAFTPGAVLDINDNEPYVPVVFPSLTGMPTITNGAVSVASPIWTLRESDLTGGIPLTITGTASLDFPEGAVTVDVTDTDYLASVSTNTFHTLISAEGGAVLPGNTFVTSDAVRAERWRIESTPTSVSLVRTFGLIMLLR
jgi:hypothetical protein